MFFSKKFSLNDKLLFVAVSFLILHFASLVILNEDAYFYIHDTLDSDVSYLQILSAENKMFDLSSESEVAHVMTGIPRSAFRSGFEITPFLFYILPAYKAYIFNYILVHLIGFIGMFLLLRTYFVPQEKLQWVVILCSLTFAFAGYYTIYGWIVPGLPLLSWAFLNLRYNRSKKWINYSLIALYVFGSLNFLIAPFILLCMGLFIVYDAIKSKKINWDLVWATAFYVALIGIANYQLIYTTLMKSGFDSHREEWVVAGKETSDFIRTFIKTIAKTHYHVGEFYTPLIIAVSVLGYYYFYRRTRNLFNPILIILAGIVFGAFFYPLSYTIVEKFSDAFPIIKIFQINRFYFLFSFAWIIVLAIAIRELSEVRKLKYALPVIACIQLFIVAYYNPEVKNNSMHLLGQKISEPTFSEYVAKDLFCQVETYIKKPKKDYRIVSLGIHPTAAQLNGFYTLDGYHYNYPLAYKHEFRKIIAPELEKNKTLQRFFDYWGSRCYIFADELGVNFLYGKDNQVEIQNLDINTQQLKLMGCEYIFSTVRIKDPSKINILLEKRFTSANAFMDIYLYKII